MANGYPYANTNSGLANTLSQLRSAFPSAITDDTLKQWGFAPKSERYIRRVLRFLNVIDDNGKKNTSAAKLFLIHDDQEFRRAFAKLVLDAYGRLFELHGDSTWQLSRDQLITFFRQSDHSSATVGKRQAQTFEMLAKISGKRDKESAPSLQKTPRPRKTAAPKTANGSRTSAGSKANKENQNPLVNPEAIGLTVRIELNLPATEDQAVYDAIFESVRRNFMEATSARAT